MTNKEELIITKAKDEHEFEKFVNETKLSFESYLSKDEFIEMIKNIKFEKVKSCELELITGIIVDCKDLSKQILYKHIKID